MSLGKSRLNQLKRQLEELMTQQPVSFAELFNPEFMAEYTDFATFEELVESSGFKVKCEADFAAIADDDWDAFIAQRTKFPNWLEMHRVASKLHMDRRVWAPFKK